MAPMTKLRRRYQVLIFGLCGAGLLGCGYRWYAIEAIWREKSAFATSLSDLSERVQRGEEPVDQLLCKLHRLGRPTDMRVRCVPKVPGTCEIIVVIYRFDFSRPFFNAFQSVSVYLSIEPRGSNLVVTDMTVNQSYG